MEAGGGIACINTLRSEVFFLMNFNEVNFFFSIKQHDALVKDEAL